VPGLTRVAGLAVWPRKRGAAAPSEWELFWQKVEMEPKRLETDKWTDHAKLAANASNGQATWEPERKQPGTDRDLRAAVAALTRPP